MTLFYYQPSTKKIYEVVSIGNEIPEFIQSKGEIKDHIASLNNIRF